MIASAVNIVTLGIMFGAFSRASEHEVPILVILGENYSSGLLSDVRIKPAVQVALGEISRRVEEHVYANFTLKCTYSYVGCSKLIRSDVAVAVDVHFRGEALAFFGPPCADSLIAIADLSASWNVPVLSPSGDSTVLHDKARFPTLTRTAYDTGTMNEFVLTLFKQFNWTNCMILHDEKLKSFANRQAETLHIEGIDVHSHLIGTQHLDLALEEAATVSRSKIYN